jgi:hypothetical protein
MKTPNPAPMFACLYPGLCDVARQLGYALAIHGSVVTDLDLIACPWTAEAVAPEQLRSAIMDHVNAVGYADLLRREGYTEGFVQQIIARGEPGTIDAGTQKPHGRISWNLYLNTGTKIDLSVMPRSEKLTQSE